MVNKSFPLVQSPILRPFGFGRIVMCSFLRCVFSEGAGRSTFSSRMNASAWERPPVSLTNLSYSFPKAASACFRITSSGRFHSMPYLMKKWSGCPSMYSGAVASSFRSFISLHSLTRYGMGGSIHILSKDFSMEVISLA